MQTTRTAATTWQRALGIMAAPRSRHAAGVGSFALLTAISAKVAVPIGMVPFTFQTLAVVLAGALLGARLGAASQVLYLALGVVGVPVFFGAVAGPAYLLGPTGGYLITYPLVAFLVGTLAGASALRNLVACTVGLATIYAGGVSWLAVQSGWDTALSAGLLPFVAADMVKMVLAVGIIGRLRDRSQTLFTA
jgi:biotin transport system substrate-specific component